MHELSTKHTKLNLFKSKQSKIFHLNENKFEIKSKNHCSRSNCKIPVPAGPHGLPPIDIVSACANVM